jgi:hypothetical protein
MFAFYFLLFRINYLEVLYPDSQVCRKCDACFQPETERPDSGWNRALFVSLNSVWQITQNNLQNGRRKFFDACDPMSPKQGDMGHPVCCWCGRKAKTRATADPSLRLKNGYAQDDTTVGGLKVRSIGCALAQSGLRGIHPILPDHFAGARPLCASCAWIGAESTKSRNFCAVSRAGEFFSTIAACSSGG